MPPARSWAAAPRLPAPLFRASHGPSSDCAFPVAAPGVCHSSPEGLRRLCGVWKCGSSKGELQGLFCLGLTLGARALEGALCPPQLLSEAVAGIRSLPLDVPGFGFQDGEAAGGQGCCCGAGPAGGAPGCSGTDRPGRGAARCPPEQPARGAAAAQSPGLQMRAHGS